MKKTIAICVPFLVGMAFSVAANTRTGKPHFATELAVSKTQNEVVNVAFPSMEMVFVDNASEVVNYIPFILIMPVTIVTKAFEAECRTVVWQECSYNLIDNSKTKPIYLINRDIRQLTESALIRSVC